jgi:hypothetical protein
MESSLFCLQKIRKTLRINSDRKAAGFGSPRDIPLCQGVFKTADFRPFRPRMEMDPATGLGSTKEAVTRRSCPNCNGE